MIGAVEALWAQLQPAAVWEFLLAVVGHQLGLEYWVARPASLVLVGPVVARPDAVLPAVEAWLAVPVLRQLAELVALAELAEPAQEI